MTEPETSIATLPIWRGRPVIEPLVGGLSNASFLVTDGAGRYVARLGQDYPFHHVSRERELMTARAAFTAGLAPEVVFARPGLMVSRFIDGRVFDAADVRANVSRIADIVRRFHTRLPAGITGPAYCFWVFHVIRDYAHTLAPSRNPLARRLPELLAINAELEQVQAPLPIVYGHNDLLPANILDDGHRLWLIDFEYAGFGTAMFDLAGLASNAGFDAGQSDALVEAYFGRPPSEAIRASHAAMQCASLLREALWALVSELYLSAPGADYGAYAQQNFDRFDAAFAAYRTAFPESRPA